jgi:hypothetical protein
MGARARFDAKARYAVDVVAAQVGDALAAALTQQRAFAPT